MPRWLFIAGFIAASVQWAEAQMSSFRPQYQFENEAQLKVYQEEIAKAITFAPIKDLEKLRNLAEWHARQLLLKAQEYFGVEKKPLQKMVFVNLISDAGQAYSREMIIELNEIMFLRNYRSFINEIIPHEVAHLVAYHITGYYDYFHSSKEWQQVMEYLVGYLITIHNLDVYPSCMFARRLELARNEPYGKCCAIEPPRCEQYFSLGVAAPRR